MEGLVVRRGVAVRVSLVGASLAVLAACGGGGGSASAPGVVISDTPVLATDARMLSDPSFVGVEFPMLQVVGARTGTTTTVGPIGASKASLTNTSDAVVLKAEALNEEVSFGAADNLGIGTWRKTVDDIQWTLDLWGGVTFLNYLEYGIWSAENVTTGDITVAAAIGGLETPAANVPTVGSVNYAGFVIGNASNATDVYRLFGDVDVNIDFASGVVSGQLSNVVTTASDGSSSAWNIVDFTGSMTSGTNGFTGTTSVTAANANPGGLGAGATGAVAGLLFGPAAEEVGGVWNLSDGTTEAAGSFGAN